MNHWKREVRPGAWEDLVSVYCLAIRFCLGAPYGEVHKEINVFIIDLERAEQMERGIWFRTFSLKTGFRTIRDEPRV